MRVGTTRKANRKLLARGAGDRRRSPGIALMVNRWEADVNVLVNGLDHFQSIDRCGIKSGHCC